MIDAHVHLWQLGRNGCTWPTSELAPIHRSFSLEDLSDIIASSETDQVILVQSQEDEADTSWLLSIADDPMISGIVGWANFLGPDAVTAIGKLAFDQRLLGLRPMVQDREADWYDNSKLDEPLSAMTSLDLVLDALVRPKHLPSLSRLALRHPELVIVIDHGAKPQLAELDYWSEEIGSIARLPNVHCKLSGLLTELPPGDQASLALIFERLWDAFGAERLVWGSDWPVLTLAGSYQDWLGHCRRLVPPAHHDALFDLNARRIYGSKLS